MTKHAGGRPPHERTEAIATEVMLLSAHDWTRENIAKAIGIDHDTLRKHYAAELEDGWMMLQRRLLNVMIKKADEGSMAAVRWLSDGSALKHRARGGSRDDKPKNKTPAVKPAVLGKKEARDLGASVAIQGDPDLMN